MSDSATVANSAPASAAPTVLGNALTAETAHGDAQVCVAGRKITAAEGERIVAAAAEWAGTPYSLVGNASVRGVKSGGDCSGSTNQSYGAAGFPYLYQATRTFIAYAATTHRFVELDSGEKMQPGDILWWPGHVAIFADFKSSDPNHETSHEQGAYRTTNNMWTAFNARTGIPYGPFDYRKFRPGEAPRIFRYFLHHGEPGC